MLSDYEDGEKESDEVFGIEFGKIWQNFDNLFV